jgi:hypothetical protein
MGGSSVDLCARVLDAQVNCHRLSAILQEGEFILRPREGGARFWDSAPDLGLIRHVLA